MNFTESFIYLFSFIEEFLGSLPPYDMDNYKSTRNYQQTIASLISSRFTQSSDSKLKESYSTVLQSSRVLEVNPSNKPLLDIAKAGWFFVGENFYDSLFYLPFENIQRSFFCHIPKTAGTALMKASIQISTNQTFKEIRYLYVANGFPSIEPSAEGPNMLLRALRESIAIKNALTSNRAILLIRCGHYCLESELNRLKNVENVNGKQRILVSIREPFEIIKSGLRYYFGLLGSKDLAIEVFDYVDQFQENYYSWKSGTAPLDVYLGKKIALSLFEPDRFTSLAKFDEPISNYISKSPDKSIDYLDELRRLGYTIKACTKPNIQSVMFLLDLPYQHDLVDNINFDKPVNSSGIASQEFSQILEDNELRELLATRGWLKYSSQCYTYIRRFVE